MNQRGRPSSCSTRRIDRERSSLHPTCSGCQKPLRRADLVARQSRPPSVRRVLAGTKYPGIVPRALAAYKAFTTIVLQERFELSTRLLMAAMGRPAPVAMCRKMALNDLACDPSNCRAMEPARWSAVLEEVIAELAEMDSAPYAESCTLLERRLQLSAP